MVLLEAGAEIDARNESDEFPLLLAVANRDQALARELVARGAEVRNGPRWPSMLHAAAREDSAASIGFVLELGLPVDGRWPFDRYSPGSKGTALHIACVAGRVATVEALMRHGAQIDARSDEGWTPLHMAAGGGYAPIVERLLDGGADPLARDTLGRTVLHVAAEMQREEVLRGLRARCAPQVWSELVHAADRLGRTPLHLAAWSGSRGSVRELLPASDRDARTNALRWTPAHLAAFAADAELVDELRVEGEEPPRDALGRTPADLLPVENAPPAPDSGPVRIAPITAEIAGRNIVSWIHSSGHSSDPWMGSMLQVWTEGAYVRRDRNDRDEYTVGVLGARRVEVLLDELRETGLLEHANFDLCVVDGPCEELRIRTPDGEHSFAIKPHRVDAVYGGLLNQLPWTECMRALEVLRRVRADVEDPLAAHESEGLFADFSRRKGRQPR